MPRLLVYSKLSEGRKEILRQRSRDKYWRDIEASRRRGRELYQRRHRYKVQGKDRVWRRVDNKPQYPEDSKCVICRAEARLVYHHWTDAHPEWGMYLCYKCHVIAEIMDKGQYYEYLELKKKIEEGN